MVMPLESAVRPATPAYRRSVYRKRIGKPPAAQVSGISPGMPFSHGDTSKQRQGMDVA